jgi:hypothetical protein
MKHKDDDATGGGPTLPKVALILAACFTPSVACFVLAFLNSDGNLAVVGLILLPPMFVVGLAAGGILAGLAATRAIGFGSRSKPEP